MPDRPFARHQASTRFLRVPAEDWPKVRFGAKSEFRTRPRDRTLLTTCELPTPVVAYTTPRDATRRWPSVLMVLEARRLEPLMAIDGDHEALARECQPDYAHFRRYWRARNHGRYAPLERVWVWRVRPFRAQDVVIEGARLLRALYGEHMPEDRRRADDPIERELRDGLWRPGQ